MNTRTLPAACLLMTMCVPAAAGMIFKEVTAAGGGDREASSRMVTETMIEGARARITTVEAPDNPMMRAGSYMLAPGGDVMYMVNPEERTYARFDLGEIRGLSQSAQSPDGPASIERAFSKVELAQELDEAGPVLLGLPTRHYKYTLAYVETMKAPGSPKPVERRVRETHEFWTTSALPDAAAAAKLATMNEADAGDSARRAVTEAEASMQSHGFILKKIVNSESSMKMPGMMGGGLARIAIGIGGGGRNNDRYTSTREIVELRQEEIADSMFVLPSDYTETELFAAPGAAGMPDLNGMPGGGEPDLDAIPKH